MEDITRNIQNARDRYPGVPVFLYGHSLGGNLVLYYTLTQKPELKGVIATSPGLATAEPLAPALLFVTKLLYRLAPSAKIKNGLDLAGLSHDPQVAEKYVADPLVHPFISPRLALDMLNAGNYCVEHASEFPLPLLLMQGTADRLVSPKRTKDFAIAAPLSKITYKEWEGFFHEMHNEPQKADVINTMIGWMDQEIK
jgi:alpha-beta hydrolase superfamily lysophospholipase